MLPEPADEDRESWELGPGSCREHFAAGLATSDDEALTQWATLPLQAESLQQPVALAPQGRSASAALWCPLVVPQTQP